MTLETPELAAEVADVVNLWLPAVRELLDGRGGGALITSEMHTALTGWLGTLKQQADPEFLAAIEQEETALNVATLLGQSMNTLMDRVNALSVPVVFERLAIRSTPNPAQLELRLNQTTPSQSYQLQRSTDLSAFVVEGEPRVGNGGSLSWNLDLQPSDDSFYRLEVLGFGEPAE